MYIYIESERDFHYRSFVRALLHRVPKSFVQHLARKFLQGPLSNFSTFDLIVLS